MRTRILTAVLAMFSIVAFAQKKEIRKAGNAVEDGNYQEAKDLLSQAEPLLSEAKDKDKVDFYLNKGKAYLGTGENVPVADLMTAAEAYKEAQNLGSDEAAGGITLVSNALVNSAIADQTSGNSAGAAEKLYTSYQLNKQDTTYLYFAASNAVNAQDYDTALEYYLELRDLGYTGIETQYLAKNVETGEMESMAKDQRDLFIKSGTYVDPVDEVTESRKAEIVKNIALIYSQLGEPEKAIAAMEDAKAENPEDTSLLLSEADLYYQLGDIEKYRSLMEEVVQRDPNNAVLFYNLGVTTAELGEVEKAVEYYEKALELDPEMVNARNNIALATMEKRTPLVEEMNALGMSAADNKRYEELEAEILDIYRESLVHLEKVLEIDPTRIETARTMMNIYSLLEETEKVEAMKQKIAEIEAGQ